MFQKNRHISNILDFFVLGLYFETWLYVTPYTLRLKLLQRKKNGFNMYEEFLSICHEGKKKCFDNCFPRRQDLYVLRSSNVSAAKLGNSSTLK